MSEGTMSERQATVLISASPLVRAGLRAGLQARDDIEVVATSESWASLPDEWAAPGVVAIIDMALQDEPPLARDDAAAQVPAVLLVADKHSAGLSDWLARGFSVLPAGASIPLIAAAAHAAAAGLVATAPGLVADALRVVPGLPGAVERGREPPDFEALTPRELQVLVQMSDGMGNREIAQALQISAHTAKFHVAQIIAKLDASSRAHAVAKALRAGLVPA